MARHVKIAAAQLGPLNLEDTRADAVKRLLKLFREAVSMGAKFIVFPELALTTFFPRWWWEDMEEVERRFFERAMPNPTVQPLFDLASPSRRTCAPLPPCLP